MNFDKKLELFCQGALECLLWTHDFLGAEVAPRSEIDLNRLCEKFVRMLEWKLDALANFEQDFNRYSHYGHDFVLTWNGHGAGYWDLYTDYDDYYSRATADVLTLPLRLAVKHLASCGELQAYRADGEEIVRFEIPAWRDDFDRNAMDEAVKKWLPEFPNFITRHVPDDLRVRFVAVMCELGYIEKVKQW